MAQGSFPGSVVVRNPGLMAVRYFTTSGTFNIADYPGAQSIRVRCQAGGGGGTGKAAASPAEFGSGGGGGGYAESLLDVGVLPASVSVTIGTGGAGGGAGDNLGTDGGTSSFGSLVVASGGGMGVLSGRVGGRGGVGTLGDLLIRGGGAEGATTGSVNGSSGIGGGSHLGGNPQAAWIAGTYTDGPDGELYGGGGSAGWGNSQNAAGGAGARGIVIVEVYSTYKGGDTGDFASRQYVDEQDQSTEWIDVTFENGWVNYATSGSWEQCQYRKAPDGRVELRGLMRNGTLDTAAFTLPEGFRPAENHMFAVMAGGSIAARLDILWTGAVQPRTATGANNGYFSLAGVAFDTEA